MRSFLISLVLSAVSWANLLGAAGFENDLLKAAGEGNAVEIERIVNEQLVAALIMAVDGGHLEAIMSLVKLGADPKKAAKSGKSALQLAREKNLNDIGNALEECPICLQPMIFESCGPYDSKCNCTTKMHRSCAEGLHGYATKTATCPTCRADIFTGRPAVTQGEPWGMAVHQRSTRTQQAANILEYTVSHNANQRMLVNEVFRGFVRVPGGDF